MVETQLGLIVLSVVCVALSISLGYCCFKMSKFAGKALEHALGFSADQREMIRIQMEMDRQELLLREARASQSPRRGHRPIENEPNADPMIPIEPNTQT